MLNQMPGTIDEIDYRRWESFAPYFEELLHRPITAHTQRQWLEDWSHLTKLYREAYSYTYIQKTLDTGDEQREQTYLGLVENVQPPAAKADQALKQRLLALEVDDRALELMLRELRADVALFREENLPIMTELTKLSTRYDKLAGGLAADWDGERQNLNQLSDHLNSSDRATRERAWQTIMDLWQSVRAEIDAIYMQMLALRHEMARNADLPDQRAYAFQSRHRFDYTPEDCYQFHAAIEAAVVPAVQRILERKRQALGYEQLRPWEWVPEMKKVVSTDVGEPLRPYRSEDELIARSLAIFNRLDPQLGRDFATLADDGLLDLTTRQGKAMGAYCSGLPLRQRPFIFANGSGSATDVQTLLHEAGHAFHGFAAMRSQPLVWLQRAPMEFNEVASMAMELLAAPYLTQDAGGFYTPQQAARHRIEHLEGILLFFPYMAAVDAFQHWVYTNVDAITSAADLDAQWLALEQRFLPGIDWRGLEHVRESGWHRKLHIFRYPFYYIEYGMAQVGALQLFRNSRQDHRQALDAYRAALALGGTRTLPELFAAAGAEFRFDPPFMAELVAFVERTIDELYTTLAA